MTPIKSRKLHGINIADFFKEYLSTELYHSFDCYDIDKKIDELKNKFIKKNINAFDNDIINRWCSTYKEFNQTLRKIRYKTPSLHMSNPTNAKEEYDKKYHGHVNNIDRILKDLFEFFLSGTTVTKKINEIDNIEELENSFIKSYYEAKIGFLERIIERKNNNEKLNPSEQNFYDRFIISRLRESEKHEKVIRRILSNKLKRYKKRNGFWRGVDINDKQLYNSIYAQIEKVLIEGENAAHDIDFIIFFLLNKYHIVNHQYSVFDFNYIDQYLHGIDTDKARIEKMTNVVTFIRIAIQYVVNNRRDKEDPTDYFCTKECLKALCFLKRGAAYLLLDNAKEAFDDFTMAEIRLSKVAAKLSTSEEKYPDDKNTLFYIYHDLLIPYIFYFKGEIYRRNFSYYNAHQYLCNSQKRLEHFLDEDSQDSDYKEIESFFNKRRKYLEKSIKLVRINIAKGKTFLELGEFRKSLKWYFISLLEYFRIVEAKMNDEGQAKNNQYSSLISSIRRLTSYLDETRLHSEINKYKVYKEIQPILKELGNLVSENKGQDYPFLLSDICLRLSMVLHILNLPDYDDISKKNNDKLIEKIPRHSLVKTVLKIVQDLEDKNNLSLGLLELNRLLLKTDNIEIGSKANTLKGSSLPPYQYIQTGNLRDMIYRAFSIYFLRELDLSVLNTKNREKDKERLVARRMLRHMLLLTEEFSTKNAELYKYLMGHKTNKFGTDNKDDDTSGDYVYLFGLQRYSSINPALVRPSAFKIKGGGLFIVHDGYGIAIDPGINFIENLYSEGFNIADIDCIIATHDHIDHTADIDTILSAFHRKTKIIKDKKSIKPLTLILNPTVSLRYNFLLYQKSKYFRRIELCANENVYIPIDKEKDISIKAIKTFHHDLGSAKESHTIGIILNFKEKAKIAIMGDTYGRSQSGNIIKSFLYNYDPKDDSETAEDNISVVIAHINGSPMRELLSASFDKYAIDFNENYIQRISHSAGELLKQIAFSYGYEDGFKNQQYCYPIEKWEDLFPNWEETQEKQTEREDKKEIILGEHLMLRNTIEAYKIFMQYSQKKKNTKYSPPLFLIAETNEEMGNYRHKVAKFINDEFRTGKLKKKGPKCFTADIGLCVRINLNTKTITDTNKIEIRCSHCELRNDYHQDDQFHSLEDIKEVCLKHEDEGLYYFCSRHDPEGRTTLKDFGFIERLERYQPFKHIEIRVN